MTLRFSQRLRLALATVSLVPLLGLTHPALAGAQDTALTLVQRYDFGRNLQGIGLNMARDSRAYPQIVQPLLDAYATDVLSSAARAAEVDAAPQAITAGTVPVIPVVSMGNAVPQALAVR